MHGEKKDNLLGEKKFAEVITNDVKINQKSLIDSTSCNKPEGKVMPLQIIILSAFHSL